jgi:hypothetical protein
MRGTGGGMYVYPHSTGYRLYDVVDALPNR